MSSPIELPMTKIPPAHTSPRNLIIFSKPKVGKTELVAQLEECLLLDLEGGSDFVGAMKVKAGSVEEIKQIGEKIKEAGRPYKYIAVDTVTKLEEMCIPFAEILYAKTPMGSGWFRRDEEGKLHPESGKAKYGSILGLPQGGGYMYLREAMTKILEYIGTLAPRIILLGHVKDAQIEKSGAEFTSMDLDLTGKLKRIVSSQSDAIGYLYRKGKNQNVISFKTTDEIACGARPSHLKNQEIVISEMTEEGLKSYWDKIYTD